MSDRQVKPGQVRQGPALWLPQHLAFCARCMRAGREQDGRAAEAARPRGWSPEAWLRMVPPPTLKTKRGPSPAGPEPRRIIGELESFVKHGQRPQDRRGRNHRGHRERRVGKETTGRCHPR